VKEGNVRALHFDCFSGISGDMTLAALIDAGVDAGAIRQGLDSLGLPIRLTIEKVRKAGFAATAVHIDAPEEHEHRHLPDIEAVLSQGSLTQSQRDIAGVAIALDLLGAGRISSRSVVAGSGMVKCAHGQMPVPAPATTLLLRGAPLAQTSIKGELTTPTGAAILATVVQEWVETPAMTVHQVGVGAGQRELLEQPNVLRVLVGETADRANPDEADEVWMLETNLDDVPAEVVGYCFEPLFAAGALDVFATPIQMKKNRPGVLLSVLAPEDRLAGLEAIVFRETGTLGVRRYPVKRHKLRREAVTAQTPWGPVQGKRGWRDGGPSVFTPEYEDCVRVARAHGVPLREVYRAVQESLEDSGR
jgi:uncharacterized protein (TIGR00299 family) protein